MRDYVVAGVKTFFTLIALVILVTLAYNYPIHVMMGILFILPVFFAVLICYMVFNIFLEAERKKNK